MTYTKKQFLEDVAVEATALKEHATKEELAKLDFSKLQYDSPSGCIYGSMTGWCRNERAIYLIRNCCTKIFNNDVLMGVAESFSGVGREKVIAQHSTDKAPEDLVNMEYVSSIEAYIYMPEAHTKNLIAFLKGERKDLVL